MADVSLWNPDDQVITQYLGQMALKAKEKDMLLSPESMAENVVCRTELLISKTFNFYSKSWESKLTKINWKLLK